MTDINIVFCRKLLNNVMEDIRKLTTIEERKTAYTHHFGSGDWEFYGPNNFYWRGEADNAYDAKAKGWLAWQHKLEQDATKKEAR